MSSQQWEKFRVKVICVLLAILIWLVIHQAIPEGNWSLDWSGF